MEQAARVRKEKMIEKMGAVRRLILQSPLARSPGPEGSSKMLKNCGENALRAIAVPRTGKGPAKMRHVLATVVVNRKDWYAAKSHGLE